MKPHHSSMNHRTRTTLGATATAACMAAALLPAAGDASTASSYVTGQYGPRPAFDTIVSHTNFLAAPGENNDVTLRRVSERLVFTEAALPLTASPPCVQRTPSSASCAPGDTVVEAGDGNDRVDVDSATRVDGGPGDDTLTGLATLIGGPGSDTLTGTPPAGPPARSRTGQVPLLVDGGQGERDTYVGARNNAAVSYEGRSASVEVDLGRATNEDRFVSIRSITGGTGNDALTGDAQPNELVGGRGRDRLEGGTGNDLLFGGDDGSADTVSGGGGDDRIVVGTGGDRVSCGAGVDRIVASPATHGTVNVPADCERAVFEGAYVVRGVPTRRGRFVFVRVDGVGVAGAPIALFAGRRLLGRSRPVKRRGTYRVVLGPSGRGLARRGRTVDVLTTARRTRGKSADAFRYRLR